MIEIEFKIVKFQKKKIKAVMLMRMLIRRRRIGEHIQYRTGIKDTVYYYIFKNSNKEKASIEIQKVIKSYTSHDVLTTKGCGQSGNINLKLIKL